MSFRSRTLSSVVSVLLCGASAVALADTAVFINEVHYDNDGADIGEAIEVVGPSGTDLSNWRVVLYNGSNSGAATTYSDRPLSQAAVSGSCGSKQIKVLQYPQDGVQNGTADAIALVDAGGAVVQFLSYEGTATASNGPAVGMTSVDIGVSEPGTTTAGTSLQLSGTGSEYGEFSWQASATQTFGNCNNNQSFGPAQDVAPSVLSTTPANGTGGHAVSTDITVNFSEAVTVGDAWYSLSCGVSGPVTATVSGSGASRTLNPGTDFASGESCTLTVYADEVTDLDLPADPMADDFSMTFTTAGDLPPSVSATTPANNATGFPLGANLSVTFSEAVTLDNGWYTLNCSNSGGHVAQVGANGNTYTLDPTANFTALEDCTLTILGDHVHDQDGTVHDMGANYVVNFETGADVSDYYAGVDTSSGPALKAWLHNRIKDHTSVFYSQTYIVMNKADEDPSDTSKVWDVYMNASYPKQTSGAANYNREHTWPKSLGFPNETDGGKPVPPHTDGHMLYASHVGYNSDRGNKPYGECNSGCTPRPTIANHNVGGGGGDDNNYFNGSVFEVWNHRKGDMARAVMYMVPRYQGGINANGVREPRLELTDNASQIVAINAQGCTNGCIGYMGLKSVLLNWNDQDPPDAQERLRNDAVYSFQGNRNPFIDHPEWARCVFENTNCPVVVDAIFASGFEQ
ncbi:endonuclease [Tahibacter harae]|uniref:Endonuclease n=1 Tax=Tahibacter harae TaxID=2963937 RepID=A0ABT1QW86_9GAMM|nr:endonuclease [Tahibacter harae]MCQ4166533.1 endonuclease [Tahibacter harae]